MRVNFKFLIFIAFWGLRHSMALAGASCDEVFYSPDSYSFQKKLFAVSEWLPSGPGSLAEKFPAPVERLEQILMGLSDRDWEMDFRIRVEDVQILLNRYDRLTQELTLFSK